MISTNKCEINKGINVAELYNIIIEALANMKNGKVVINETQENPFLSSSSETFEPLGEIKAMVKQNIDVFEEFEESEIAKIIGMLKRICSDTKLISNKQKNFLSNQKPNITSKPRAVREKTKRSSTSDELQEFENLLDENDTLSTEFSFRIRDFFIFIRDFYGFYNFSISPVQSLRVLLMGNICDASDVENSSKKAKKATIKTNQSKVDDKDQTNIRQQVKAESSEEKVKHLDISNLGDSSLNEEIKERIDKIKAVSNQAEKASDTAAKKQIYKLSNENSNSNNSTSSLTLSHTDLDHIEPRSYTQNQRIDLADIADSAGPFVFNIYNAIFNFQKNNTVTFYEVSGVFNLIRSFFPNSPFALSLYQLIVKEYILFVIRIYRGNNSIRVFDRLVDNKMNIKNLESALNEMEIANSTNSFKTAETEERSKMVKTNNGQKYTRNSSITSRKSPKEFTLFDGIDTKGCVSYCDIYAAVVARCCNAFNGAFLELSLELTDLNKAIFAMILMISNLEDSYFSSHFTFRELFYCVIRSIYDKHHEKIMTNKEFTEIVESLVRVKLNWKLVDDKRPFSMDKIYQTYFKSEYKKFIGKIRNTKEDSYRSLFYRFNYSISNRDLKIRFPNKNSKIINRETINVNEEDASRILITNVVHNTPKNYRIPETYAFSPFSRRIGEKTKDKGEFKSSRKLRFN